MSSKQFTVKLEELPKFISQNFTKQNRIYLLSGDLGSGKTTFVKQFLEYLEIPRELVTSPTYTLVQTYQQHNKTVHHLDLYRLQKIEELNEINIAEILDHKQAIIFIEWPQLILPLNQNYTQLRFYHTDSANKRTIEIEEITT